MLYWYGQVARRRVFSGRAVRFTYCGFLPSQPEASHFGGLRRAMAVP